MLGALVGLTMRKAREVAASRTGRVPDRRECPTERKT